MGFLSLSRATRHGDLGNRTAQALPRLRTSHATYPNTQQSQPDLSQTQHSILHSCKHYVNLTNVSCEDQMPVLSWHMLHLPYGGSPLGTTVAAGHRSNPHAGAAWPPVQVNPLNTAGQGAMLQTLSTSPNKTPYRPTSHARPTFLISVPAALCASPSHCERCTDS